MDTIRSKLSAPACREPQQARSGTWTKQEEDYVQALIKEFRDGHLPLNEGTSLRGFLAKMLDCKPKRISKKYGKTDYNGAHLYTKNSTPISAQEMQERHQTLKALEIKFLESLAVQITEAPHRREGPVPAGMGVGGGDSSMLGVSATTSSLLSQRQALAYVTGGLQQQHQREAAAAAAVLSDSVVRSAAPASGLTGLDAATLELFGLTQPQRESSLPFSFQQQLLRERVRANLALDSLRGNAGLLLSQISTAAAVANPPGGALQNLLTAHLLRNVDTTRFTAAASAPGALSAAAAQSILAAGLPDRLRMGVASAPASSRDLFGPATSQELQTLQGMIGGAGASSELERLLLLQRATDMSVPANRALRQALAASQAGSSRPSASSIPSAASLFQTENMHRPGNRRDGSPSDDNGPETKRPRRA